MSLKLPLFEGGQGGGDQSIRRKPANCRKSLSNCIEYTSKLTGFELTTLVVIGTDCIGSCKSGSRN
jgi:hypothetical protein